MCAAGGGKTTTLVKETLQTPHEKCALVTYTANNQDEIRRKFYEAGPALPPHVEVFGWLSFLLREMARPYRNVLHNKRIESIVLVEGRSDRYARASDPARYYFAKATHIYSDKLAKFVCVCDHSTNGNIMRRLRERFDHILIDEVQDLAGYDLDVLELMLKAGIRLTLAGDHRQATYRTNNAARNSSFSGSNIVKKFSQWHKAGLATLMHHEHTHRCNQEIADLGDVVFPGPVPTQSRCTERTGHDGVFVVPSSLVTNYVDRYHPQVLRLDKRTDCNQLSAMNFGDSKGLGFDRVLIFPHQKAKEWLKTGRTEHIEGSKEKMYVGVTRARYSVAFVLDGPTDYSPCSDLRWQHPRSTSTTMSPLGRSPNHSATS